MVKAFGFCQWKIVMVWPGFDWINKLLLYAHLDSLYTFAIGAHFTNTVALDPQQDQHMVNDYTLNSAM